MDTERPLTMAQEQSVPIMAPELVVAGAQGVAQEAAHYRLTPRRALALGLTLLTGALGAGEGFLGTAAADAHGRPAVARTAATGSTSASESTKQKCRPGQVELSVTPAKRDTPGMANFMLNAASCKTTFNGITLIEVDNQQQKPQTKRLGNVASLSPGKEQSFSFSIPLPGPADPANAIKPVLRNRTFDFNATSSTGKSLGHNQSLFVYQWPKTASATGSFNVEQIVDAPCKPDPRFTLGVQEDKYILWGTPTERAATLDEALRTFPETRLVRLNAVSGEIAKYGMKPLKDAVDAIKKRHLQVAVTLVPTPSYDGDLLTQFPDLSFANYNPDRMRSLAKQIATTLRGQVAYYTVGNEPNVSLFNKTQNWTAYDALYRAGREGILAADRSAEVDVGEIDAGDSLNAWVKHMSTLPNAAVAIHPYAKYLYDLRDIAKLSHTPIKATEYGIPSNEPHQLDKLRAAVNTARCAGVKTFIAYEIYASKKPGVWDTGFAPTPMSFGQNHQKPTVAHGVHKRHAGSTTII